MSGWLYLNTDASRPSPGDPSGRAAIGAVLRQHVRGSLVVVDYISKTIRSDDIHEAEYRALIEGLKLARSYDPTELHVYSDRSTLVNEVKKGKPTRKKYERLFSEARGLMDGFERIEISYVPREMNMEADQRSADALLLRQKRR